MFGKRLRVAIEARGETQTSVAAGISVSPQAVGKWVAGGAIDEANLKKLAGYLHTNWLWLRYGEDALRELEEWRTTGGITKPAMCMDRVDFILSRSGCGLWELDLLSGSVSLVGMPDDVFEVSRPETVAEMRLLVHAEDTTLFDRFLSRTARSNSLLQEEIRFKNTPDIRYQIKGRNSLEDVGVHLIGVISPLQVHA